MGAQHAQRGRDTHQTPAHRHTEGELEQSRSRGGSRVCDHIAHTGREGTVDTMKEVAFENVGELFGCESVISVSEGLAETEVFGRNPLDNLHRASCQVAYA